MKKIPDNIRPAVAALLATCGMGIDDFDGPHQEVRPPCKRCSSFEELGEDTGLSRTSLWREVKAGHLVTTRIGRRVMFASEDVDTWLKAHKCGARRPHRGGR
jgi:excisionase family DNA binding protein